MENVMGNMAEKESPKVDLLALRVVDLMDNKDMIMEMLDLEVKEDPAVDLVNTIIVMVDMTNMVMMNMYMVNTIMVDMITTTKNINKDIFCYYLWYFSLSVKSYRERNSG